MKLNETNIQPVAVIDIWKFRNENPGASLNLVRDELKERGGSAKKGERNGKSVMIISGIDEDTLSSLFFELTGKDIDDYIVVGDWAEEFECGDSIVESMKAVLDKELGKDLAKDVDAIVRRFKSDVKTGDIKAEKTEVTFKKISETIDRRLDENNRKKVLPWVIAKLMLAEGAKEYPKTNVEFGKKYPVIHAFAAHAHKVYKVNQSEVMKAFKALTKDAINEDIVTYDKDVYNSTAKQMNNTKDSKLKLYKIFRDILEKETIKTFKTSFKSKIDACTDNEEDRKDILKTVIIEILYSSFNELPTLHDLIKIKEIPNINIIFWICREYHINKDFYYDEKNVNVYDEDDKAIAIRLFNYLKELNKQMAVVVYEKFSNVLKRKEEFNKKEYVTNLIIYILQKFHSAHEFADFAVFPKDDDSLVRINQSKNILYDIMKRLMRDYGITTSQIRNAYDNFSEVNEKKKDCCPKNPNRLVSLKEQLFGSKNTDKKVTESKRMSVNSLIDMISGKTDKNKLKNIAIQKAMLESANPNILGNRAELLKRADLIECAKSGAEEYHKGKKINNKPIKEYSTSQLEKIVSRLNEQIAELNKKVAVMNESEGVKKLKEELDRIVRLQNILSEEIVFRMIKEADENSDIDKEAEDLLASVDFKNTNPNEEDNSSDDNADDSSEEDNESNPDEDEVEEISSIKIYVTDKQTAEDLQAELIEDGVPEEAVEIYAKDASDEDEDSSEEDENSDNDADEENSEKTEECAKSGKKDSKKVNEDEGDEENADNSENDENAEGDDADAENSEDEGEWVVALVDTDYVDNLKTVLVDKWGMTEEEFIDQIGGEIVENPDGDSDEDNDEGSSEDDDNADSDNTEGDNEDDDPAGDLDPDQLFKGI